MFNLDIRLFNTIYHLSKILGNTFCFSAFEGFVMYVSVIALGIVKVQEAKKKKVKK